MAAITQTQWWHQRSHERQNCLLRPHIHLRRQWGCKGNIADVGMAFNTRRSCRWPGAEVHGVWWIAQPHPWPCTSTICIL